MRKHSMTPRRARFKASRSIRQLPICWPSFLGGRRVSMRDERRAASSAPAPVDLARVTTAVGRGRDLLLSARRPDGSWIAYCDLGPAATAQVVVGLRFVDRLDPSDAEAARRW